MCELVSPEQLEPVSTQFNGVADLEFLLLNVVPCVWVFVLGSFEELSFPDSTVLVCYFVYLDSVISTEERNDEGTGIIVLGL